MRVDEYNSFESLLLRYREALACLEIRGVRVVDQCRLRSYESRLSQLLTDPRPAVEGELVFAATFDLREIDELIEIVEHLPDSIDPSTFDLLRKLAGGNEHPDDDASAPAREAQYELYLGTVLRRGGIPAHHGAPDLAADWQGQQYFIEAKRPGSSKSLDDRLRSAAHQIRKLPRLGIVAICADQLLRPACGLIEVSVHDELALAVDGLLMNFIREHRDVLRRRLSNEPLAALLWTARLPARISSTGHSALGTSLRLEILSPGPEAAFASAAMDAYLKAQNESSLLSAG